MAVRNECRAERAAGQGDWGKRAQNAKKPGERSSAGFFTYGRLAVSYFHTANAALSSALRCFTVLFGMGRGGTTSLWPPDINWSNCKKPKYAGF